MRCRLLSALVLLGAISFVHADYVIIVVNLNAQAKGTQGSGQMGVPGMGNPGMGGRQRGVPGMGGQQIGRPGMGGQQIGRPGMGGQQIGRPGMGGLQGGVPGMGVPPPGMGGLPPGMGGLPPGMGGLRPGANDDGDADESPDLVVAVVDIVPPTRVALGRFLMAPNPRAPGLTGTLKAKHRWGLTELTHKSDEVQTLILPTPAGKPVKSVQAQFKDRFADLEKGKEKGIPPTTGGSIELARWALGYGLVAEYEKVMDELAKTEKTNSVVAAYLQVKADLARPVSKAVAAPKGKLFDGFRLVQSDKHHFAILHKTDTPDMTVHLDRLERDYKRFYYWWASKGIHQTPPAACPVAVLTDHGNDFRLLQKNLTASPLLNDSFADRREGIAVYSSKRADPVFTRLEMTSKPLWDAGFDRRTILKGGIAGVPKTMRSPAGQPFHISAATRALVLKALEEEWEANAMSNESARQLMVASRLLPANVAAPEWLQSGVGSFFETPLQSPFGGPGSPNPYWLPRFKEYDKAKRYGATPLQALLGVVTDSHFRAKPQGKESPETVTRHARAAAWALYFYLAQNNLDGLQKYFKEIARMPRDIELDAVVLKAAFARAFDCVNVDRTPNDEKLSALAKRWVDFSKDQTMDAEAVHKIINGFYAQMTKPAAPPANTGGNPGTPPALPGGINPGGQP